MPYRCKFTLQTQGRRALPPHAGRALHGAFFHWIESEDRQKVSKIHDDQMPKPFAISPLFGGDGIAHFYIGLLDDILFDLLDRAWRNSPRLRITQDVYDLACEPECTRRTYAEIAHEAGHDSHITLQFQSPTSFKHHDWHYPLPDPVLVFSSYRARWNAFSPEATQIDAEWDEWLSLAVTVSRLDLRSELVNFGETAQIGFMGKVVYEAHPVAHLRDGRPEWHALADFAQFSGTGHRTTKGLGYTRRLNAWNDGD